MISNVDRSDATCVRRNTANSDTPMGVWNHGQVAGLVMSDMSRRFMGAAGMRSSALVFPLSEGRNFRHSRTAIIAGNSAVLK